MFYDEVIWYDFVDLETNDVYFANGGGGGLLSGGLSFYDSKSGLNLGDSRTFLKCSFVEP